MSMRHPIRYRVEWMALVCMRGFAMILPESVAVWVGAGIGRFIGVLWRKRRAIARRNLARAFPDWTESQVKETVGLVFANFGRTTFEILRINDSTPRRLLDQIECPNSHFFDEVDREGKGALLLSGHIGNWELLAGWIRARGFPLDVVVKPMRNPLSDAFYNDRRRALDLGIIHTQVATRSIVEAVRNKHFVAILADQYAGEEGVDVEFFGRKVSTPRGPAVLTLKFGCPIIFGTMARIERGRFRLILDEPMRYQPSDDPEADIRRITQDYTARLEAHIRSRPDQWLWTHRRWRD